jgi:type III secretion protein C
MAGIKTTWRDPAAQQIPGARRPRTRGFLFAQALTVALLALSPWLSNPAQAGSLPNPARKVSITAREQPLAAFLQDLGASVNVPVAVSTQLTASVNGTFTGPADKVLRDVSRIYNLVTYFDGAVMHVVPASDLMSRAFPVSRQVGEKLLRDVYELGLPDERNQLRNTGNGQVIAVGTRRFIEQIDELIRAGQAARLAAAAPAAPGLLDFRVFYLRYAWAQDTTMNLSGRQIVVPGVASILRSLVGARGSSAMGSDQVLRPTQPKLKGQGLAGQGVGTNNNGATGNESQRARNGADTIATALNQTQGAGQGGQGAQQQQTESQAHGYDPRLVSIEVEPRLNAVIVRDTAERLPRYEQLIAALDVEPQSLEVEATIIDINTDKARELGINWRWNNAGYGAEFSGTVPTVGAGGIASAVLGSAGQFISRIRALQQEGAARVVSSPQVVTLSNVEAVFDNTSTFFVRVAGRDEVDLFNVSAGTSLRVMPHVFRDRNETRIKLLVNIEDGNLTGRQVDQIPVVERSTINTQALILEGESLLIGGMVREASSTATDKVPGLGDVPVVGNLFKNKTTSSARIERMFLITPRLAASRPDLSGAAARAGLAPAPAKPAQQAAAPARQPVDSPTQPVVQAAAPAPAPAPAPPAPTLAPAPRASVVLDLDTMPAAPVRTSGRPTTASR